MRSALRRLVLAGCASVMVTLAMVPLSAASGPAPDDKQTVQQLTANYLAQMNALDAMNAAFKFGPMFEARVSALPGGDDAVSLTQWYQLPPIDPASAARSISSLVGQATEQDVFNFMTQRCGRQGLGQTLAGLNAKLDLGMPPDVGQRFDAVRDKVCQLVMVAANFKARYDKYQSIKQNGIMLVQRYREHKYDFSGHTRHVMGSFNLVWFPDLAETVSGGEANPKFTYASKMKYSDRDWTDGNLLQRLSDLRQTQPPCRGFPFPLGEGLTLKLQVTDANSSSATVEACMHFHFIGDSEDMGLGSMTFPAPFGYLAELESMKDGAKQQLANQIVGQISGMFSDEQKGKINTLYQLIEKLQGM